MQSEQICFWLFNNSICLFLSMQVSQSFCFRQQASWLHLAAWLPDAVCTAAWPFQSPRAHLISRAMFPVWDKAQQCLVTQLVKCLIPKSGSSTLLCFCPSLSSLGTPVLQQGECSLPWESSFCSCTESSDLPCLQLSQLGRDVDTVLL